MELEWINPPAARIKNNLNTVSKLKLN